MDDYDDLEHTIEEQARIISSQIRRIAELESAVTEAERDERDTSMSFGECKEKAVEFEQLFDEATDLLVERDRRIEELESALRPFAERARELPLFDRADDDRWYSIEIRHWRAAAAAMEAK